jgi:hypothetical protein
MENNIFLEENKKLQKNILEVSQIIWNIKQPLIKDLYIFISSLINLYFLRMKQLIKDVSS